METKPIEERIKLPDFYVWERTGTSKYGALYEPEGAICAACITLENAHHFITGKYRAYSEQKRQGPHWRGDDNMYVVYWFDEHDCGHCDFFPSAIFGRLTGTESAWMITGCI